MTRDDLRGYLDSTTNLSALERVVKSRNLELYNEIVNSWKSTATPKNFIEIVYQYFNPDCNTVCAYGNQMTFEYYRTGYKCKKTCKCTKDKKQKTMFDRYGVKHALQSPIFKEKLATTLLERYGADNLEEAFRTKRLQTNMQRYGVEYPLKSSKIHKKTTDTYKQKYGYANPFDKFNSSENVSYYASLRYDTYQKNHPRFYDFELIKATLQSNSYQQASQILGLWPTHLKKIAQRQGWEDLLPKKSSYEQVLSRFFDDIGVRYVRNSRSIIPPYELDFYFPDHGVAIEFNGLLWHTEEFGSKDKRYHLVKTELCELKNIRLIHVYEDDWLHYQDTVMSIIYHALDISNKQILYGRNTILEKISSTQAYDFCQQFHLRGGAHARYNYGLFYEDNLISTMTFRRIKGNIFEISRYCNSNNYAVVGGAARLLNAFVNDVKKQTPIELITYSDRGYATGNVYAKLGFVRDGVTVPEYWYVIQCRREHRLNYTKKKLAKLGYDSSLTELEIMKQRQINRIWDCGSTRWKMILGDNQ